MNARYQHGVGRVGSMDGTTGTSVAAMGFNKGLDRDEDGTACEAS